MPGFIAGFKRDHQMVIKVGRQSNLGRRECSPRSCSITTPGQPETRTRSTTRSFSSPPPWRFEGDCEALPAPDPQLPEKALFTELPAAPGPTACGSNRRSSASRRRTTKQRQIRPEGSSAVLPACRRSPAVHRYILLLQELLELQICTSPVPLLSFRKTAMPSRRASGWPGRTRSTLNGGEQERFLERGGSRFD